MPFSPLCPGNWPLLAGAFLPPLHVSANKRAWPASYPGPLGSLAPSFLQVRFQELNKVGSGRRVDGDLGRGILM